LEWFNTQPWLTAPIFGVTAAMEEEKANGKDIDGSAIQAMKIGLMGPLAGVGDPIFWDSSTSLSSARWLTCLDWINCRTFALLHLDQCHSLVS
jgi:PTS system fructose-specific IID component